MANLKKTALSISIAFVMMLFIHYGIETFYPGPDYERCNEGYPKAYPDYARFNNCSTGTTQAEQSCYIERGNPVFNYSSGCPVYESCNYCYRDLEDQRKPHDRNVFILASALGIIAILLATMKLTHEYVSTGIMGGGVLSVLYGTVRYWSYAENLMKFIALGLVLAILIWIGYKNLKVKSR